ncbi:MAG: LamG-like jellyroll fold domain-containing protein [Candidatus Hatepunaea meridiana]|nr:LamG-like jellyroll fold domain-containing protein [Candidatus Hatepunaea meridiana]
MKNKISNRQVDIKQGTVIVWIKEGQLQFNDNNIHTIMQTNPPNGSIFLVKDNDNYLKFIHIYIGKGRTDVEYDVSDLNPNKEYKIAVAWGVKDKEIIMYINGEEVARSKINYKSLYTTGNTYTVRSASN